MTNFHTPGPLKQKIRRGPGDEATDRDEATDEERKACETLVFGVFLPVYFKISDINVYYILETNTSLTLAPLWVSNLNLAYIHLRLSLVPRTGSEM